MGLKDNVFYKSSTDAENYLEALAEQQGTRLSAVRESAEDVRFSAKDIKDLSPEEAEKAIQKNIQKRLALLAKAEGYIKNNLDRKGNARRFELALPVSTLNKVRAQMGRDFNSHNLDIKGIRHARNNHGVGGAKIEESSIPLADDDLLLIPYIMVAPDYVTKGSTDFVGRESVRFYKNITDGYVVVVEKEWIDSDADLETINMWAEKLSNATLRNSQVSTSETVRISRSDAAKIRKDAEIAIENDVRLSVISEKDTDYLSAVERGDMETAQRMVDEAAKLAMPNTKVVDENGNPKVVYHQTNAKVYVNRETGQNWDELNWKEKMEWDERDDWEDYWEEQDFNTFSRVNARTTNEFDGFFFAPKYDEYHEYGERTIAAFVNIQNPASREDYNIESRYSDAGRAERVRLQEAGFDGVIRMDGEEVDEYIAFEPSQIKSADAVTYDDEGNVIPLSERFNPENSDIRFSARTADCSTNRKEYTVNSELQEEIRKHRDLVINAMRE